jgi:hypothetical protein
VAKEVAPSASSTSANADAICTTHLQRLPQPAVAGRTHFGDSQVLIATENNRSPSRISGRQRQGNADGTAVRPVFLDDRMKLRLAGDG